MSADCLNTLGNGGYSLGPLPGENWKIRATSRKLGNYPFSLQNSPDSEQNNQLDNKSHDELEDNSNVVLLFEPVTHCNAEDVCAHKAERVTQILVHINPKLLDLTTQLCKLSIVQHILNSSFGLIDQ